MVSPIVRLKKLKYKIWIESAGAGIKQVKKSHIALPRIYHNDNLKKEFILFSLSILGQDYWTCPFL